MLSFQLLAAHMLGDYILQTNYMAAHKFTSWNVRTLHVALYTLAFSPIAWLHGFAWWFLPAIFVTHWITDCRRWAKAEPWPAKPIMVDQTLHAIQIAVIGTMAIGL